MQNRNEMSPRRPSSGIYTAMISRHTTRSFISMISRGINSLMAAGITCLLMFQYQRMPSLHSASLPSRWVNWRTTTSSKFISVRNSQRIPQRAKVRVKRGQLNSLLMALLSLSERNRRSKLLRSLECQLKSIESISKNSNLKVSSAASHLAWRLSWTPTWFILLWRISSRLKWTTRRSAR